MIDVNTLREGSRDHHSTQLPKNSTFSNKVHHPKERQKLPSNVSFHRFRPKLSYSVNTLFFGEK
jgi:hypothetical protein